MVLLIWEECSNGIQMFLIPDKEAMKFRSYLEEAHDRIVGSDEMNDGMRFLLTILFNFEEDDGVFMEKPKKTDGNDFTSYRAAWKPFKVKNGNPITETNIVKVYKSGFLA